ncbi:alpha/beta hydrolase [Psychrobacter frigidicola]|uniref:Alpha/beta hydrolase n=1 Tax=Psychrobacter frigidicola TaxID=45611 RepID=A0A5C7A078_9GAMM|nr:alpha/beta hydrolase [Psychrobacter frigidicola]TXD96748.1 alpha/beta hydrolase [Psychrobacter frigidicola]
MPILPIPSLQALVTKVVKTVKMTTPHSTAGKRSSYQLHQLYYVLKALGRLPTPLLERLNDYLDAPNAKQYKHADAHLRLILAISSKLKRPLNINQLVELRHRFATDVVAMQDPKVWQQSNVGVNNNTRTNISFKSKNRRNGLVKQLGVSWQDKTITNADGDDMAIRCYRARDSNQQSNVKRSTDKIVMLFFHGGGFCIGNIDTHHEFCHRVCAQTGWAVVSVDYRLAPEYPAPTALRDSLAAYAWLAEHCQTLGAPPSRIVLAGDSAGGCLAILTSQQVTEPSKTQWQGLGEDDIADNSFISRLQDLPRPLAQLSLYPVTDIATDYPSWALYGQGLLLDHDDIEVFDSAYMQHSVLPRSHTLVSPMHGNNTHMCPSYIVAAELDILRDEALAYAAQLQKKGILVQSHTVIGAPHGFIHLMSINAELGRKTDYVINQFAKFVGEVISTEVSVLPTE